MSIQATKLSVTINGRKILDDLNFTCRASEITAIVGENGAGKSTLLNCLAGVSKFAGELTLNQYPIESLSLATLAKYRAVLPQSSSLNFPFSVHEVVRLAMSLGCLSQTEQEKIIADSLALVDATQFIDRDYLHLSGGEKQRVQLARVLAQLHAHDHHQNRFLFLDEPTSALDLKHQYSTLKMLRELCTPNNARIDPARNIGALVIVHDLNLASFYCDKILLLDGGRLIAHDTPEKIFQHHIIKKSFGIDVIVASHPDSNKPYLIPRLQ
ncbi:MAG: iron complex transport system ATP-binding protein [Arenicella sp.]|jgi:iron complex transport system ATP-binding protein